MRLALLIPLLAVSCASTPEVVAPAPVPDLRLEVLGWEQELRFWCVDLELVNGTDHEGSYRTFGSNMLGNLIEGEHLDAGEWREDEGLMFHGPHPMIYSCSRGYRNESVAARNTRRMRGYVTAEESGERRVGLELKVDGEQRMIWSEPFSPGE